MSGLEEDQVSAEHIDNSDREIDASSMMGKSTDGEVVEECPDEPDDEDDDAIAVGEKITDAAGIDWKALWEEFGFDTPDAVDSVIQPETRVVGALESSEQGIGGDAETLIADAVENGTLKKKETPNGALRGYLLEAMLE